uniref:Uncharacterized protein LOC104232953 n=1 Tax=Nicotiana sylvestris TaxID=4096 RepID=A0A1U7XDK2_NICSY|nr:PREDICTED: uncharacterized protein LOC104232953 [Nicotiana sylvestris]
MAWFKDGDRNTKLFHAHVNGKRRKLQLKSIQDMNRNWILDQVPVMLNEVQNCEFTMQPTIEEVKKAVFGLNGDSAGDLMESMELPKFVTHTNLVLLPKKKDVQNFSDLRPISLSNFSNKIISRVIHERLVDIIPNIISDEQAGFVKGTSIAENVLLTQEIITDIRLRTKVGPNVVLKLDMMMAYDRLFWIFLTKIMRKMGFSEWFIGLIFGIVSNNWYSVQVNSQPHGFFKSTRGVKQGGPLSPTLFILVAEAMSRGLNALHHNLYFCGFGIPKWSPKINHLAYADDAIIFSSSNDTSLRLIMEVLNAYEAASGQLINKAKSAIYVHHSTSDEIVRKIEGITGIQRKDFPFIYLGCPIFYKRRKMEYYEDLISKVLDKLQAWKGKLLSIRGRAVLISSVLQTMPIHLLSAVNPSAYVLNKLHKLFGRFYWSNSIDGRARHWASWYTLCLPKHEGGVGFRSLNDMSNALFCKLWGNFRTKLSLWSSFMSQKYLKKMHTTVVPWRGGSHIWRKMLECRDSTEHLIFWKLKMGSSLFWFHNWTGLGALYFVIPPEFIVDETIHNVNDVIVEGQWDEHKIREILPGDLAMHIMHTIQAPSMNDELDKPIWCLETRCQFTVKSAWEYLRRRKDPSITYDNIWVKGLPFKISFFMWKLWKALKVWSYFYSHAGLSLEGLPLHQAIVKCWTTKVIPRLKPIFQALPSIIVWELWKRRNNNKHGWTKINTDMASKGNPGRSSIGFCLRNEEGDLVYACGKEIQEVTNTQAETTAILEALKHCLTNEMNNIWVETDSMLLKKVITREWKPP